MFAKADLSKYSLFCFALKLMLDNKGEPAKKSFSIASLIFCLGLLMTSYIENLFLILKAKDRSH